MQTVAIIGYCSLAAEFFYRYNWDRPVRRSAPMANEVLRGTMDKRLICMLQAMLAMTIFILIRYLFSLSPYANACPFVCRTVYRVIEFSDGWNGKVILTQWLFSAWSFTASSSGHCIHVGNSADVFDGTMITLAMWTLNLFHPGIYLRVDDRPSPAFSEGDVWGDHEKPTPTGEGSVTNSSAT